MDGSIRKQRCANVHIGHYVSNDQTSKSFNAVSLNTGRDAKFDGDEYSVTRLVPMSKSVPIAMDVVLVPVNIVFLLASTRSLRNSKLPCL